MTLIVNYTLMVQVLRMVSPVISRGNLVDGLDGRMGGDVARVGTFDNMVGMGIAI